MKVCRSCVLRPQQCDMKGCFHENLSEKVKLHPLGPAARNLQESDKDKLQKLQKGEAVPEDRLDGPQV